jgi:signal transduction histidine kinase
MRQIKQSRWYLFLVSLVMLCFGGILFFVLLDYVIEYDIENKLQRRKNYTINKLMESDSIIHYQNYSANMLHIEETAPFEVAGDEILSDTIIYDKIEQRNISYRKLTFKLKARDHYFYIELRRSLLEKRQILGGVIVLVVIIVIVFSSILAFLNHKLSKKIWHSFQGILDNIKNYNTSSSANLSFPKSEVEEFDILSHEITNLTHKIQKEFIENTSHEMKTPLAIINNKLELLLQSDNLTPQQLDSLNSSIRATKRLSKLNDSLLLLARIKNKQYDQNKRINLNALVSEHLHNLTELTEARGMIISTDFTDEIILNINPFLADILIENLISNAILHNNQIGSLVIQISEQKLTIINTGDKPNTNPQNLFDRFSKSSSKTNSLGLGLSIIKSICDSYQFRVKYTYENERHRMEIDFNQQA